MKDPELYNEIEQKLAQYQQDNDNVLIGIVDPIAKDVLIRQMIDSIKRIRYIKVIGQREITDSHADPSHALFDPIKAAYYHLRQGDIDEAIWLVFLLTHFGKHSQSGWGLVKAIYGRLNEKPIFTWRYVVENLPEFISWLDQHQDELKAKGSFSNHRKYQSLSALSAKGTGATISSFIDVFGPSPSAYISSITEDIRNNPALLFDHLYGALNNLMGFGRLAKFDFLTMVGKIGILNIEPGSPFLVGATGPVAGAKLLYGLENATPRELETNLIHLGEYLNISFAMQVLEDSICNWQKDRFNYTLFRG